jgi:hypothetical protein
VRTFLRRHVASRSNRRVGAARETATRASSRRARRRAPRSPPVSLHFSSAFSDDRESKAQIVRRRRSQRGNRDARRSVTRGSLKNAGFFPTRETNDENPPDF